MSKGTRAALFFAQLLPDLRALAAQLFDQTEGDLFRARETIKSAMKVVGDHGEKLKEWEAETRARLDRAKARAKEREAGVTVVMDADGTVERVKTRPGDPGGDAA